MIDLIKVKDLYHENASITIKLKPRISPQNNAEIFYRKFKNQKLEINNITENITAKKIQIRKLDQKIKTIKLTNDWKTLKNYSKKHFTYK